MIDMLRAIIVDDEPLARDELMFLLADAGGVEVVGQAGDAREAIELAANTMPQVAFVDLRMPGPDGLQLAQVLKSRQPQLQVVVVSAHDNAAVRAFEEGILDYLLKPTRVERLRATIARAKQAIDAFAAPAPPTKESPALERSKDSGILERLAVRRGGVYLVLEVADVIYFEMRDELVWAVTASDRVALDLTMTNLEQRLPDGVFFRSHRGALVRVDKIRAMEPAGAGTYELVLDHPDAPRVPLARERARLLRERIPFAG